MKRYRMGDIISTTNTIRKAVAASYLIAVVMLIPCVTNAANLIPNSSFELGERSSMSMLLDRRWKGFTAAPAGETMPAAVHGSYVLGSMSPGNVFAGWPMPKDIYSACFYVPEPGEYTFSFYMRMVNPSYVRARLGRNSADPNSPEFLLNLDVVPSNNWQRFSFQVDVQGAVKDLYYIEFLAGNSFWVDAVQLEKGTTATSYSPMKPVEFALKTNRRYNVFEPGEPVVVQIQAYNDGNPTTANLELVAKDFKNRTVFQQNVTMSIGAQLLTEQEISAPINVQGSVRFELYQQNGPIEDELNVGIMPLVGMEDRGVATQDAYVDATFAKYLGLRYTGGNHCIWESIQPTSGSSWNWTNSDAVVNAAIANGQEFRAVYLLSYSVPAWAKNKPNKNRPWPSASDPNAFDLDDWDNFVRAVVARYQGKIDSWTVWNEPYYYDASWFMPILQSTYAAIKSANPQAEVCGADCPQPWYAWGQQFAALDGLNYLDVYTTHAYEHLGGYLPDTLAQVKGLASLDGTQRPIYDSETTGYPWHTYTFYTHIQPGNTGYWSSPGGMVADGYPAEEGAARWTKLVLTQHAMGFKHVMAHVNLDPGRRPSFQTRGALDADASWSPYASGWAVAGRLISTAQGLGVVDGSSSLRLFLFEKNGTAIGAVWTREHEVAQYTNAIEAGLFRSQPEADQRRGIVRDIIIPAEHDMWIALSPSAYTAYDMMGNEVQPVALGNGSILKVSNQPLYLVGRGISTDALRQALSDADLGVLIITFSPDGGSYSSPQAVTIDCSLPGATIYYTTDGTVPSDTNGTPIAPGSTININHTLTLKAVAYASGFEPSDVKTATYQIDTGLRMWLKADAGVTVDPNSGGVTLWEDQSGNENYLSSSGSVAPALATNAIGGQAAIFFAGNPGYGKFMTPPVVIDFGSNVTAFIVFRGQTYPGQNYGGGLWHFGNDAGGQANHMPYMDQIYDDFGTTTRQMVASGYGADTPVLYDVTLTTMGGPGTTTRDTFLNGVLKSSFAYQTISWAPSGVNLGWGSYYYGRGYIAEVMVYDRVLSSAAKNAIGVYLEQKYGLDTAYSGTPATIAEAKQADEESVIIISGAVISAAFTDFLYIETSDRSSGIRVQKAGHGLSGGTLAEITGAVRTDSTTGERYIDASNIVTGSASTVTPLGINNKAAGGGANGQQEGVVGGAGLNNIGLLVRVWGKVTGTASPYILDDGSGLNIKMAIAGGMPAFTGGDYVAATGVISCEKVSGSIKPILLVKDAAADVRKF